MRQVNVIAYAKPILLLPDENTACGSEAFAAVFQDNKRGLVVGKTTQGVGGAIGGASGGYFSEAAVAVTSSLFVRGVNGFRPSYIQNTGVRPDAQLDFMTKANLLDNRQPFAPAFMDMMLKTLNTEPK